MIDIVLLDDISGNCYRVPRVGDSSPMESFEKYLNKNPNILLLKSVPETTDDYPHLIEQFGKDITIFKYIFIKDVPLPKAI